MRGSFKIKSRSVPHNRQKLYDKITVNFSQEKWRLFLQRQLLLESAVRELSRAQFGISNQNQHKISVRQNFQIKKEIAGHLQREEIDSALNKLHDLSSKMEQINQDKGVKLMIVYLQSRNLVKAHLGSTLGEHTIQLIRSKLAPFQGEGESFLVKIKTNTILSILLLRFHGILMSSEERNILVKTIELKKRKLRSIDLKAEREGEFECMLYLINELYKILFLLKKDQQMIMDYYSTLHALTSIYTHKTTPTSLLDLQELQNVLTDMKPVGNDLNIYQDSKLRKELAFQRLREEIMGQDQKQDPKEELGTITKTGSSEVFRRTGAALKGNHKDNHQDRRVSIFNKSKLQLNHNKQGGAQLRIRRDSTFKNAGAIESQSSNQEMKNIDLLTKKGIAFEFLLPLNNKAFIVFLGFAFRNGFSLVDLTLRVTSQRLLYQKYFLRGLQNAMQSVSLQNLGKLLQRIVSKVFASDTQFAEMHNLMVATGQIPPQYEDICFALVRAKAIVKEYLRTHYQEEYMMGKQFVCPPASSPAISQFLRARVKDQEGKRIRTAFDKRKGFLLKGTSQDAAGSEVKPSWTSPEMLYVKLIIGRYLETSRQLKREYYMFNVYYNFQFKGLDVFGLEGTNSEDSMELSPFIAKMKQIAKNCHQKHKIIHKGKTVSSLLLLQNKPPQRPVRQPAYRFEEQLQLTSPCKLIPKTVQCTLHFPLKTRSRKKQRLPDFETIRTSPNEYAIFRRQMRGNCTRLRNDKCILDLPASMKLSELSFEKRRVRMYKSIKICEKGADNQSLKTTVGKGNVVVTTKQSIVLKCLRHFVVAKARSGYLLVLEYEAPDRGHFVYEVVVSPILRYYCLLNYQVDSLSTKQLDIALGMLCGKELHAYTGNRQEISEANFFYLNCVGHQQPNEGPSQNDCQ